MRFIVYTSKNEIITRFADFVVIADNEKEAEKKIKEELSGTCLSERLMIDNDLTEKKESKIFAFAEEPDSFNENEFKKSEFICTCDVDNDKLLKLAGFTKSQIKDWHQKITESYMKENNENH